MLVFVVLNVYWRENAGQAPVEHNAKIMKSKSFVIVSLVGVSTGRSEQRVICRTAGRASASCSRACQQDGCLVLRGQFSAGFNVNFTYLLSKNVKQEKQSG